MTQESITEETQPASPMTAEQLTVDVPQPEPIPSIVDRITGAAADFGAAVRAHGNHQDGTRSDRHGLGSGPISRR